MLSSIYTQPKPQLFSTLLKELYYNIRKELNQRVIYQLQQIFPTSVVNDSPSIILWLKHAFCLLNCRNTQEKTTQYQPLIQKLQGDIRQHIRVQHQMKLCVDQLNSKLQETTHKLQKAQSNIFLLKKNCSDLKAKLQKTQTLGKQKQNKQMINEGLNSLKLISSKGMLKNRRYSQKSLRSERPTNQLFERNKNSNIIKEKISKVKRIQILSKKQSIKDKIR